MEFDIEIFTAMLRRKYSKHLSEKTIQELEDRWHMDERDRAFSTASTMCKAIPERDKTKEFHNGIYIIQQRTFCQSTRSRVRSPSNERRNDGSSPVINKKGPIDLVGSDIVDIQKHICKLKDEKNNLANRLSTLEYYVKVLARGVCEQNMEDIQCIQYQGSNLPMYETLHAMANTVEKMITRIPEDDLYEKYVKIKDRYLTLFGENKTLGKLYKTKCHDLESCQEEMSRLLQCADTIRVLKDEINRINTWEYDVLELQEQFDENSRYSDLLLGKNIKLSKCADDLKVENEALKVKIFEVEHVVRLLQKQKDDGYTRFNQGNPTCQSDDSKVKDLKERMSNLQRQIDRKTTQIQNATKRANKGDMKNEALEKQNTNLQRECSLQKQEIQEMRSEITEKDTDIQKLQRKLNDKQDVSRKSNDLESTVSMMQHEISEADQRNNEMKTKLEQLKQELQDGRSDIAEKENHIQYLCQNNAQLQSTLARKNQELQTVRSELQTSGKENSLAKERSRQLQTQLEHQKQELVRVRTQITEKLKTIQDLEKMLDDETFISKKRIESEASVIRLQREISESDNRNKQLQRQYEHQELQLQQLRSEINKKEKDIQDLRKKYDEEANVSRKRDGLETSVIRLHNGLSESDKRLDERANSSKKHNESSEVKVVKLQQEKSDIEKRFSVLQNQHTHLEKELQQLRSEKDEQEQRIQDLRKKLDERASSSRKRNESNDVKFAKLQQEKSDTEERYNVLQNQQKNLKKEIQQVRSEKDEQDNYIQDLGKNIERLQRKLDQHTLETAQSDIQRKDTSYERLEKDANLLQTKLQRTESELQIAKEKYDDIQKSNERLEKDANLLRTNLQRTESKLQISKEKYDDIQKRLSNIGKNSQRLGELESMLETVKKEKHDTEESYATLRKDAERLQEQFQKTQTELRLAQERNEDLKNRYERLEKDANLLRTKLQGTESELRISKEKYDDIQKRVNNIGKNSQRLEELEGMLEAVKKEKHDTEESYANLKRDAERLQKQYQKTKTELRLAQEKNEDLQNRFSKVAAAQLTHDNPNIADLSDKNRPTKLAEAFSELYDNEWTEAYSAMEDDPNNTTTEEDIVKKLKNVLLTCFSKCTDISTSQIQGIKALLLSPSNVSSMTRPKHELSTEQAKAVNDLRKQTTAFAIESVKQVMAKDNAESRKYPAMKTFIEKCAELCWLMVVQSPPVFIDDRHKTNDRFDKDIFKAYTKGGHSLDYVVWPPVYLHRGGPLLCKGTAQGK